MQVDTSNDSSASQCPFHTATAGRVNRGAGSGIRPPMIKAMPFIGPVKQFTGDVMPFLNGMRKQYGEAFRLRIVGYAKQDFAFGNYTIRQGDEVLIQIT